MKINCEIEVLSDVEHVRQIYAGFSLLHGSGYLKLKQVIPASALENPDDPDRWTEYRFFNVKVVLNGKLTLLYDMHDREWIDEEILSGVDFYFKRSFDRSYVEGLAEGSKVFPLGFNYPVTSSDADMFKLKRSAFYTGKERLKMIAKAVRMDPLWVGSGEIDILENLESGPKPDAEPKVLYMAKLWDPDGIESKTQAAAVGAMNEIRAECVRALRKEFGERFFGGLARDEYSVKKYADVLLPDESLSNKRNYLKILAAYPICVATTGLNRSNGWKLGEYIAFSKAIITEPLHYEVPGNFVPERNYLEFRNADELVSAAARLMEDVELRRGMMRNNHRYYQAHVRPDALVRNTLEIALSTGAGRL